MAHQLLVCEDCSSLLGTVLFSFPCWGLYLLRLIDPNDTAPQDKAYLPLSSVTLGAFAYTTVGALSRSEASHPRESDTN